MTWKKNVSVLVSWEGKTKKKKKTLNVWRRLHRLWQRSIFHERRIPIRSVTVPIRSVTVPIRSVTVSIRLVTVQIQSITVHLARRRFQDCVVYCLLPPTLVYFAVLQPGLFSVYCLIHCTTTRTTFSALLYCNQDCSQCIVSYTVQPLGPPSVLCCTAARTVLSVLSHTLYNH